MFAMIRDVPVQPCLVLAHPDPVYAAVVGGAFRRLGWAVAQARSGPEAHRLACQLQAQLVILDTELPDESGWLTCAKLTQVQPPLKVVLVSPQPTAWEQDFADYVGAAALCGRQEGPAPILPLALELTPAVAS
jgi:CheY-like chemotaxis protein